MKSRTLLFIGATTLLAAMAVPRGLAAQESPTYTVLYSFTGADGEYPLANVNRDQAGNLYSTAFNGGDLSGCGGSGCGVVFKLDPAGKETVLYNFEGGADGAFPAMGLVRDEVGNLYSTTHGGGDFNANPICAEVFGFPGCGVVFKVDTTGKESVIYAFSGGADGLGPASGLVRDEAGNLYGTTGFGGDFNGECPGESLPGCGVVFKVDPTGKETVLHTFTGVADGVNPSANLLQDEEGNLYGTAVGGGDLSCSPTYGCGVVFKIAFPYGADLDTSQEGAAARDQTTDRPRAVLPENVQKLLQQRRAFGRFGAWLMEPQ
jgi:uncharacterized repeat protein (TIGR03803 family)